VFDDRPPKYRFRWRDDHVQELIDHILVSHTSSAWSPMAL
jgi:hypothetical protein